MKGYKHTELGWIPEDWELAKLSDYAKVQGGFAFDSTKFKNSGKYQVVKMSNFYNGDLNLDRSQSFIDHVSSQEEKFILKKGNIVITLTGTIGKKDYGYSYLIGGEANLLLNQRLARIIANDQNVNSHFLFYEIKTNRFLNQFFLSARGGTGNQANVSIVELSEIKIVTPLLKEQVEIAKILSVWVKCIEAITQLIAAKQQLKKGLIQQLLAGKIRIGRYKNKVLFLPIYKFASQLSEKNKEDLELVVLSCTKYSGLVPSLEFFGKRVFSKDLTTYKIVEKNCFAYATNHIEEGSIGYQSRYEKALISPMYTVFKTNESVCGDYLYPILKSHYYIQEYKRRMEGSIDRRGGLRWEEFSKIEVPIPSFDEQMEIAKLLNAVNLEIDLYETELTLIQQQKNGLMQQLLTGKKRVKV